MTSVGFIGLGAMGGGMALNLARNIDALHVFDASKAAMRPLLDAGAHACTSPGDVARKCDLVFLCLPYAPEVRDAIFGDDGIVSARSNNLSIVDATTLDRTDAISIAEEVEGGGISYADCPVSGMPFRAHDGTLTVMFGGTDEAFAKAKPYLDHVAATIIHAGPIGTGQAMKALNNVIYDINIAALAEIIPLAVAIGLDPDQIAELVLTGSSSSFASKHFVPRMIEGKFSGDFSMQAAYKDIVNVQRMQKETNAWTPIMDAMVGSY